MRTLRLALLLNCILVALLLSATHAAASVAYIDGGEVWVSTDDASAKLRLSGGQGNWTEVAQSDQGFIVGVQRDSGKQAIFATFTVWNPGAKVVHSGSLSGDVGGSNAYPLGLDITPDGGLLVYGFSHMVYGYLSSTLTTGTYLKATADATTMVPVKVAASTSYSRAAWPSLVGTRIVATNGKAMVSVQDPASPASSDFTEWLDFSATGYDSHRPDFSAAGNILAVELVPTTSSATTKVAMVQTLGLGADGMFDACYLPTQGDISQASLSQNGNLVTWSDQRGVVITGVGTITPTENCSFGGAPSVISATGSYPSYGPFNVPAAQSKGIGGPTVTSPSKVKLAAALKSGLKVTVTPTVSGRAKLSLTIKPSLVGKRGKKPITLASGSANVVANQKKSIKLKFTSAGKKLKKRLKGKKATLRVTVGATATTKSLKFR